MALTDQFIDALFKHQADQLVMETGQRIVLLKGASRHPITAKDASQEQLERILESIQTGAETGAALAVGAESFQFQSPSGPVEVMVSRADGALRITLAPVISDQVPRPTASGPSPDPTHVASTIASLATTPVASTIASLVTTPVASTMASLVTTPVASTMASLVTTPVASTMASLATTPVASTMAPPVATTVASPDTSLAPFEAGSGAPLGQAHENGTGSANEIHRLFKILVDEGCSDLHLSSGNPPLFRKDGDIVTLADNRTRSQSEVEQCLLPIISAENLQLFRETNDLDFAHEIPGLARFRCNLFRDRLGMGGVFRIIPTKIPSASDLGIPAHVLELCNLTKGLIVVTGPTGSGKSTTLAAMIDHINRTQPRHIITIEDPIEFVHSKQSCLINQREVGTHTMGFKQALRAALREDPDIVLVGEMRDLETVAIALETAETGHLVFGTLHTNTAAATIDRIIDQFPSDQQAQIRVLLSDSLKGVVAQTLCKKKGGGRVAAHEILIVNLAISNLIREGKTYQIPSLMQTGKAIGMKTLNGSLIELVQAGAIEPEEGYLRAVDKQEYKGMAERKSVGLKAA